jgi:cytochrome c
LLAIATLAAAAAARAEGDPARGGQLYRACVACHSLQAGVHLTGPSLAGLWGRTAGRADGFIRYSAGLAGAGFRWDEDTLNAWLADPAAMLPGNYMTFRGIEADRDRADLIAFLALAMAPGGADAVVARGLVPETYARGQRPEPLRDPPSHAQVTQVRHCRDSYFVTTADGVETPYWETNLRLKLDTQATGPEPGKPVIVRSGMMGDRASLVFAGLEDLVRTVREAC